MIKLPKPTPEILELQKQREQLAAEISIKQQQESACAETRHRLSTRRHELPDAIKAAEQAVRAEFANKSAGRPHRHEDAVRDLMTVQYESDHHERNVNDCLLEANTLSRAALALKKQSDILLQKQADIYSEMLTTAHPLPPEIREMLTQTRALFAIAYNLPIQWTPHIETWAKNQLEHPTDDEFAAAVANAEKLLGKTK